MNAVLFLVFIVEFVTLGVVVLDPKVRPVWRWVCGVALGVQVTVIAAVILAVAVSTGVVR